MENNRTKVIKAGFGYVLGNYLLKGLSFLSIPIFARLLDAEDYGIYNNFLAYEGILFVLIGWAIHSSYKNANLKFSQNVASYDLYAYVSDTIVLVIKTTIIYLILAIVVSVFFFFQT